MQISLKTVLVSAGVVLLAFVGLIAFWTISRNSYEARIVDLQNQVAQRDQTLEVKDGVYQKLAIQAQDLEKLLTSKDTELKALKDQLDKQGSQLLTANTLVVQLKRDLESNGHVVVKTPDPAYPGNLLFQLDSKDDFDPFRIRGDMLVDCSLDPAPQPLQATLKLSQTRPLKLSVVVSQDRGGTWRSSTTSSEKNFQVDIALAAVNPYLLEPKWYEKIGLGVDIGVGTNPGLLAGLGVYYTIGKFEVGPRVWAVVDHGISPYFGAQLLWHPFQQ